MPEKKTNALDHTAQLGQILPDDDPEFANSRYRALLIIGDVCHRRGQGRSEAWDLIQALGLQDLVSNRSEHTSISLS